MKKDTIYSPLIDNLRQTFKNYAESNSRYLLVYWQCWSKDTDYVSIKPGEWPWTAHDSYMQQDNSASILAIAFDLAKDFDEQIPEHMRGYETLESFAFKPLVHIPDRTGKIPALEEQEAINKLLRPAPAKLRLVK